MVAMPVFGGMLWLVGAATKASLPSVGAAIESVGVIVLYSFAISWLGHLPLAVVLHRMLRGGQGGWLVALVASALIGAFWAQVLHLPIILPFAIVGGMLQAWLLRRAVLARASLA